MRKKFIEDPYNVPPSLAFYMWVKMEIVALRVNLHTNLRLIYIYRTCTIEA